MKKMRDGIMEGMLKIAKPACAVLFRLYPPSFILHPSALLRRPGQTTTEYLLMLAVVAGMASIMAVLFHRRILGGLFTLVGLIIGAGKPA